MDACFTLCQIAIWVAGPRRAAPLSVLYAVDFVSGGDGLGNGGSDRTIAKASAAEETLLAWGPKRRLRESNMGYSISHPPAAVAPLFLPRYMLGALC